ncbi:hypothetical protein BTA51_28140 [Hahella sp. CCB-MM4]|uniref:hypothetical protein n=1 Tax=Hahella sp. (strain CCB-MM4) TaxID=1926491 RepID=UPI000B9AF1DF|nr:hypothetical protein [Hahella sp. CCB-MM4]OZG70001.1 hypothetical protein BTA51_28140 [Hahella sp. CCB-MM4]
MNNMDEYIKKYVNHYAEIVGSQNISSIISKGAVSSEDEARELISFIDTMCRQSQSDEAAGKTVLGYPAKTYDAEKAAMILEELIEDCGFDYLIDDDLELD